MMKKFLTLVSTLLIQCWCTLIIEFKNNILTLLQSPIRIRFMSYIKERLKVGYVKSQEIALYNPVYLNNFNPIFQNESKTMNMHNWFNILKLIQMLWENCYVEMQDFLRDQVLSNDGMIGQSINLLFELVNMMDRLSRMFLELYQDSFASNLTIEILKTLIKWVSGPSYPNQKFLGNWKKLHRILNLFICQEIKSFSWYTEEKKNQINIFCKSVSLLYSILK